MPRVIVHLDADAFFASVEQAADSRLRGKPVAVGGEKRVIIASASYEARKFGVYTPMPTVRARKLCPRLVVVPGDFDKYEHFSRWMFSYAQDFTPDVEIASIDEGYFDLSAVRKPPVNVAETIRTAIHQSLKISVSEGIASNKLVSQIASKLTKPAAFQEVPAGNEIHFLHPLPNKWLPGVGPATAQRLNAAGLAHIRHVSATPADMLHMLVGKMAPTLKAHADGIDERPVMPMSAPAKSYGQQRTFEADITDEEFAEAVLRRMADDLMAKVRDDGKSIRTLTVKVRYNDMGEDQCGESLLEPTDLETDVYGRIHILFRQAWKRRVSLRLVSLKLSNVYDGVFRAELALERSVEQHDARRRLAAVVDELRRARGREVVLRGHDFRLRVAPIDTAKVLTQESMASPHAAARVALRRVTPTSYVPLSVHSAYSFLNSTLTVNALVSVAKKRGFTAIALADTGNLHGAVEFTQATKLARLQPILGATVLVEGQTTHLYVQNATGYHNLCRLLSITTPHAESDADSTEPFQVRLRQQDLQDLNDGLLVVSADTGLATVFGDRFYRAVMDAEDAKAARGARCVAALPVHYADRDDRSKWNIVQSIRTRTLLRQAHPGKILDGDFHLRTAEEMTSLFRDFPDVLTNTFELSERCTFELSLGAPQFPAFKPGDGSKSRTFLRKLVLDGLRRRYRDRADAMFAQVDEELSIIAEVGYEDYFLVVWRGIEVDLAGLEPWQDKSVWEMLASGGSRAVHHIESPAMIGLCRQCNVRDIDGLVAIVSVIRPGAANEGKKQSFARRYQGLEPIAYPHPSLEACLKSTFGLVVYEEHILQMCEAFAGLPPGRADVLRRALAKFREPLIEEIRREFFACARARGHDEEKMVEVWNLVRGFSGYAFCKAHSTAYGVEAYQSAWLKRYHPVEFMAAVLTNGKGFYHPLVYVLECHRLGIPLLPPCVNSPGPQFSVEGRSIRVPLTRVKGLAERTTERILDEHQLGVFTSTSDFYRRVMPTPDEMESMIRVGAFDAFRKARTAQFWESRHLHHAFGNTSAPGQGWLLPPPATDRLPAASLQEPTRRQRLEWETELLDFTVSGHPLELHDHIAWNTYCPVNRLGEHVGEQVVTCGLIIEQRTHHQITGEPMKFLTLADWTGMVETELFAPTYRSYGLATVRYPVLEVTATVEPFENGRGFSLRVLRANEPRTSARTYRTCTS